MSSVPIGSGAKYLKPPIDTKNAPVAAAGSSSSTTTTTSTTTATSSSTSSGSNTMSTPNAMNMNMPFSASYEASGSSVMSFPDPEGGIQDSLSMNPQTQHYLAYNTPESGAVASSFSSNVFDHDSDLKIDPLNQSTDNFSQNDTSFDDMGDDMGVGNSEDGDGDVPDSALCPSGSEATGRWTKKEHQLFTEALNKYGKEWKKVAAMVKTRTVVQTRTHAQKYFQKVMKGSSDISDVSSNNGSEAKRPRPQNETKTPIPKAPSESVEEIGGEGDDYYYYESELPPRKRQQTTYVGSASKTSKSAAGGSAVKQISDDDIPPPSPASCGKRKDAEISAIISLMGSTPTESALENGIHTLARMKKAYRKPVPVMMNTSLSIINPNTLPANEEDNPPDTPWDGEMLALESRQKKTSKYAPLHVATSKEQDDFFSKICSLIVGGDVAALTDILQAAKSPGETDISPGGTIAGDIGSGDIFVSKKAKSSAAIRSFSPRAQAPAPAKPKSIIAEMLNRIDESGNSTLHLACGSGVSNPDTFHDESVVLEMCKVLIENGASVSLVNSKMQSCVHLASFLRYQKVVNLLIMRGCPVNNVDDKGDCATHVAARRNDLEILNILTSCGVNCHIRNKAAKCALDLLDDCVEKNMNRHEMRTALLTMEPRLRTLILYHEDCLEHAARRESDWEGPDRLEGIMTSLHNKKLFPPYEVEISNQFQKAHVALLSRVHCPEYIAFVNALSKKVQESTNNNASAAQVVPFTPQVQKKMFRQNSSDLKADINCDTSFSAGTLKAARRAAGAVAHAVDRVLLGRNRNAFCVVRPPGHHAGYRGLLNGAKSCGFCIFNNVAAGAFHALETHNCERVAIIDIDVHHGNGTEDIVRRYPNPSRIFFFSLHLYEKGEEKTDYEFFPGSGGEDDTTHNIINVPLMPMWHESVKGSTRATAKTSRYGKDAYKQAISQRLIPALRAFSPDLILLSTGFDAAEGDVGNVKNEVPAGGIAKGMDLRPIDFEWTTTELLKVADLCCNGRLVSVLEGGYGSYPPAKKQSTVGGGLDRNILSECSAAHVDRLIDPYGQTYDATTSPF